MVKAKSWVYTRFTDSDTLVLKIGDDTYKVASFKMSFALDEIPRAEATLAVGRDVRTDEGAAIAGTASSLNTMLPVTVTFKAVGDMDGDGNEWPESQTIFEGYFTGFAHKKMRGKIYVVASMTHWLADLGFSSTLNSLMHTSNPGLLIAPAVTTLGVGSEGEPNFVPEHIGHKLIEEKVAEDLWAGIKQFLCALAGWDGFIPNVSAECLGEGNIATNDRALKALKRIEGASEDDCAFAYEFAKALPLDIGSQTLVQEAVASAITHTTMESFISQTFWDVIIKQFTQEFGMSVAPMIDRAMVIAYTPGWRGAGGDDGYWKTIKPEEYSGMEQTSMIPRPLRGVGIYSSVASDKGTDVSTGPYEADLGACFVSDAEADADGTILYIPPPRWLSGVPSEGPYAGTTTGNKEGVPGNSSTTTPQVLLKKPDAPAPAETFTFVSDLMRKYAQVIFIQEMLRGRSAVISGKLRFDIAPGSHVKIEGSPEKFLSSMDSLAADTFAMVQRVTVSIDAENRTAMTSFNLLNLRNQKENEEDRTSIDEHPLFGSAVVKGAPLLKELDPGSGSGSGSGSSDPDEEVTGATQEEDDFIIPGTVVL